MTASGRRRLFAWFELVRLPGVITAAADSLSGYVLLHGSWDRDSLGTVVALAATSMILYAAGMALNDVADHAIDAAERPGRPIPSGRVPRGRAALAAGVGLVVGPALFWFAGLVPSAVAALALAVCILAYNLLLKHTPLGPVAMGACRGLNFFMGLDVSPLSGFELPLAYGLFVAGITMISRSEVAGGSARTLRPGLIVEIVALACLAALAVMPDLTLRTPDGRPLEIALGLSIIAGVALVQLAIGGRALRSPDAPNIQRLVKTGVLSLVWIHVGLVTAAWGPITALPLACLWVVSFLLARWLYAT